MDFHTILNQDDEGGGCFLLDHALRADDTVQTSMEGRAFGSTVVGFSATSLKDGNRRKVSTAASVKE
jgi:hypothetical protein